MGTGGHFDLGMTLPERLGYLLNALEDAGARVGPFATWSTATVLWGKSLQLGVKIFRQSVSNHLTHSARASTARDCAFKRMISKKNAGSQGELAAGQRRAP